MTPSGLGWAGEAGSGEERNHMKVTIEVDWMMPFLLAWNAMKLLYVLK